MATVFEVTFPDQLVLGLTLQLVTISFMNAWHEEDQVACCYVTQSVMTTVISPGDILTECNGMSLLVGPQFQTMPTTTFGSSLHANRDFVVKSIIGSVSPRTVRVYRPTPSQLSVLLNASTYATNTDAVSRAAIALSYEEMQLLRGDDYDIGDDNDDQEDIDEQEQRRDDDEGNNYNNNIKDNNNSSTTPTTSRHLTSPRLSPSPTKQERYIVTGSTVDRAVTGLLDAPMTFSTVVKVNQQP